jgi:hypothetical protein
LKKTRNIITAIIVLIFANVVFFASPNLNPLYSDGLFFWAVVIAAVSAVVLIYKGILNIKGFTSVDGSRISEHKIHPKYLIIPIVPWVILFVVEIFAIPIFHSARYRDQMPQPETRTFNSDMQPLDVSELPIVDSELAYKLADKKLGEKLTLGSQVTLGEPTIQKVDGKLVWVVPLEHSGFFKWLANLSGTPGYIIVSATDQSDVTYIDKYKIKYQPDAFLLDNLKRHTRFCGGLFNGLTDYSFELDDSGKPYWVVTIYKNLLGFSMPEASGAIIVDAQTGKTAKYSISDMPSWVDRVQPEDFILTQLNNRGHYIHGIWNFSNKDKFQTSPGSIIVYNNDRCYLFTGITSVGNDDSAIGFMLVDMVTKKPYLYEIGGATQSAAQNSAEGKVQHLKYTASYPLITNVDGSPTYFMTLKDAAKLIKQYAFVSVKDYTMVGTGNTISVALADFKSNLRSNRSNSSSIETGENKKTVEGTVSRFAAESQEGSTVYKFTLDVQQNKIFVSSYDISNQLALTKEGDKVTVTYTESGGILNVVSFENQTLK